MKNFLLPSFLFLSLMIATTVFADTEINVTNTTDQCNCTRNAQWQVTCKKDNTQSKSIYFLDMTSYPYKIIGVASPGQTIMLAIPPTVSVATSFNPDGIPATMMYHFDPKVTPTVYAIAFKSQFAQDYTPWIQSNFDYATCTYQPSANH